MIGVEGRVSLQTHRRLRKQEFTSHADPGLIERVNSSVFAGLLYVVHNVAFGRDLSYEANLPLFNEGEGKMINFVQAIEEAIRARKKVRVLDIGCGRGNFSRDLKKGFGEGVEMVGISAYDWRNEEQKREDEALGIEYKVMDAQKLSSWPSNAFDCVVSVQTMHFLVDPLAVLKGVYKILRPGGYGFLQCLMDEFSPNDQFKQFETFLEQEYGIRRERPWGWGYAFRKKKPRLLLPISYAGTGSGGENEKHVYYRFKGEPVLPK